MHSLTNQLRHQLRRIERNPNANVQLHVRWQVGALTDAYALVQLALQLTLMIWLYRAATLARRLGWPARRSPFWGTAGFFVPVVSFWFPYQVAAYSMEWTDPNRRLAGRWWGWTLGQQAPPIVLIIVGVHSTGAALISAVLCLILPALAARSARQLVAAVGESHRAAVGG